MIAGRLIPSSRISRNSSRPFLRGILRSETRMCGLKLLISSSALTPSSAISLRKPHAAMGSPHSSWVLVSSSADLKVRNQDVRIEAADQLQRLNAVVGYFAAKAPRREGFAPLLMSVGVVLG